MSCTYSSKSESDTAKSSAPDSRIFAILKEAVTLGPKHEDNKHSTVYQKAFEFIQVLQKAIDEYDVMNKDTINITKPTEVKQWEQDAKDVVKVDQKAMGIALRALNGTVISGEYDNFLRSPVRSGDEVEQAAWRWLEGGIPAVEDTWGATARDTMKALAGFAKLLI